VYVTFSDPNDYKPGAEIENASKIVKEGKRQIGEHTL